MNDSIRKKRNNLCIKSQQLRSLALDRGDKAKDMRKEQDISSKSHQALQITRSQLNTSP